MPCPRPPSKSESCSEPRYTVFVPVLPMMEKWEGSFCLLQPSETHCVFFKCTEGHLNRPCLCRNTRLCSFTRKVCCRSLWLICFALSSSTLACQLRRDNMFAHARVTLTDSGKTTHPLRVDDQSPGVFSCLHERSKDVHSAEGLTKSQSMGAHVKVERAFLFFASDR